MIKKTLLQLDQTIFDRSIYRKLKPRRVHLYCTGTPRSGTSSIVTIFRNCLRVQHEPDRDQLKKLYFKMRNEAVSEKELENIVKNREKQLYLELNSSFLNYIIIDKLVTLYPKAKFIHPIRSPRAWLDSWINHHINLNLANDVVHPSFKKYFDTIFKRGEIRYAPEEKTLQEMGLPTIEGMLKYWKMHNLKVLQTVPKDRLLILRTEDISKRIKSIYEFAGITEIPDNIHTHANKVPEKHNILDSIGNEFVEQKINKYALNKNVGYNFLSHSNSYLNRQHASNPV